MDLRIIKTDGRYRRYRADIEKLAVQDPDPESPAGARLELLAKLVEDYEKNKFAFSKPDPVDALTALLNRQPVAAHRVKRKRSGGGTPR